MSTICSAAAYKLASAGATGRLPDLLPLSHEFAQVVLIKRRPADQLIIPILTRDEEQWCFRRRRELLALTRQPDDINTQAAKLLFDFVININVRLIKNTLDKLPIEAVDFDDCISCASVALIGAATQFNPDFGTRFSTYAVHCIKNSYTSFLRQKLSKVVPVYAGTTYDIAINYATATCNDAADQLNWLPDLPAILRILDPRARQIVIKRLALDGNFQTMAEIGNELHITKERVRQLYNRAIAKLRNTIDADAVYVLNALAKAV